MGVTKKVDLLEIQESYDIFVYGQSNASKILPAKWTNTKQMCKN